MTINQMLAAARSRELVRNVVHPQVAGFTDVFGRSTELELLRSRFLTGVSPQVLSGMGGVGKTSLARAYARRHRDSYGLIWWVRAEDPTALDAELRGLLEILLPPGEAREVQDARGLAYALLADRPDPWLLVLDNVPDAGVAQSLLPPGGHVLITSQATAWPRREMVLTLRPMDTSASVELLTTLSQDPDQGSAQALAAELAGLPLALSQAASFVHTNALTLAMYLRLYRTRGAELHNEGHPADNYPHTVATTWRLAIDKLSAEAHRLLNLCAFYAPDVIPVSLIFAGTDELARHRAIGELHRYSLITPAAPGTVSIHRLVQAVTRAALGPEWPAQALDLIRAVMPQRPVTAASLALWSQLHTHVHALLEHLPPEDPSTLTFRSQMSEWPGQAGDAGTSRRLCAELLPVCSRVLGPSDPLTLTVRHNLAHWTGLTGDPVAARDMFAELVPVRDRVLGPLHPDTLTTRHDLVRWVGESGDSAAARDQVSELVPLREQVLGPTHPDTLSTVQHVAYWTGRAGDPVGARELFEQLFPRYVSALGLDHPETLRAWHNLADWTGEAGDARRARDLLAELLPHRVRVLGVDNPRTLKTRHELAYWTGEAGDFVGARDLFAALLTDRVRVLGDDHLDTVTTQHNLAYRIGQSGSPEVARDMLAVVVDRYSGLLGPEHPHTLTARHNHAVWVGEAGDPSTARSMLAELVPARAALLGSEHHEVLTTRHNLAYWTARCGDPATARDMLTALLVVRERVLGPSHVDTRRTRDELARLVGEQDEDRR